ncbi:DEAD/DEAH box helicase [Isobaculum melis]|uniref:Competence protein ComFA n=1 Tax=Isobaculum melis TaxID=142588 RepID=A0A1H9QPU3_9LACT|nr:DEAD/DEAH box helicase [Isobaculum melis]SER61849.1 competence protein ComFA [Isobaculum melis]
MQQMYGRRLLQSEMDQLIHCKEYNIYPGFTKTTIGVYCTRCGKLKKNDYFSQPCQHCKKQCYYCPFCIQMGKITACSMLYHLPEKNEFPTAVLNPLTWQGELSKQQATASKEILQAIKQNEKRLVWAVAGAGKTEIVFEGIRAAIQQGKRICFASPRVDVCLEIAPRLAEAFTNTSQCLLYGGMEEAYQYTQLVVATTHQLLRFYEAFDVLIIDEIDAFPYTVDECLHYGATQASKKESCLIYLTATPDKTLQRQVHRQEMKCSILPSRYHGHPLPVPIARWIGNWQQELEKGKLNLRLQKLIQTIINQNQPLLIFLPHINYMKKLAKIVKRHFRTLSMATVYAADPERKEKVLAMRKGKLQLLFSTTILERGVTFTNVQVIVFGAEDTTFTSASLIQIAGRVGRKADFPTGAVIFLHNGKTKAIKQSIKEIQKMNTLALKQGLLL